MYLLGVSLGKLVGTFQKCPLFTCRVWAGQMGGYFLKVPTIYPLGMSWANCFRTHQLTHNVPTGYIALCPQWELDVHSRQKTFADSYGDELSKPPPRHALNVHRFHLGISIRPLDGLRHPRDVAWRGM